MVLKKTSNKTLATYLSLPYTIELTSDEDGLCLSRYHCGRLPDTGRWGQEEVLTMLDEAKELWLETTLEKWIPIPKPTGVTPS
jgi:hypothetical protein